ncbi:MAG: glycosyltransferase [Bacteroidaceae bacterium]|nr:glycosyltransferase [Bacteroidaceae bacterium]
MNKRKICFITNSLFSVGGVQRVLAVVASKLAEQYDVTILTLEDHPNCDKSIYDLNKTEINFIFFRFPRLSIWEEKTHKIVSGLYKHYLPKNLLTSNIYSKSSFPNTLRGALIDCLNDKHFDVIVGVHGGISMKIATIRKQLNAKKVIGWMHNCYDAFFVNKPAYYEGLKDHFKWQMRKLDDFIVLSHSDAQSFRKNLGLQPTVIYNPLTLTPGEVCNTKAKKFLTIGRMVPLHKGFDILIKAFAIFAQKNQDWTLDIVGDGPEKEKVEEIIHKYNLDSRITIHPFTNQIQRYYSAASIYILSSRWEGMPLVLAEAMAHGLPIISSDISISKELLNNKTFAQLFPNGNFEKLSECMLNMIHSDLETKSKESLKKSEDYNDFSAWLQVIN